jgi:serpin B
MTPFMHGHIDHGVTTTSYEAVELPYTGGQFEAMAVMPKAGSLANLVATLTPAALDEIGTRTADGAPTTVALPKFTTTASVDMVPAMKALGMEDAFGNADLSKLSDDGDLTVAQVRQRVYLQVAEKGTTAAAVTGIGISAVSARNAPLDPIVLDHPFLFLIRDSTTGTILFATEVNDPTAS